MAHQRMRCLSWIWRKQAVGYALAGVLLAFVALLILAIVGMIKVEVQEGLAVTGPQMAIFGALLLTSVGMLIWYLRGVKSATRL